MNDHAADAAVDLRRVEDVGLNALQTQQQLFYDGWLLRLSPGTAKRARSVNAFFGSTLPLARKIAYCERLYAKHDLPLLFRITPFVQPTDLVPALTARGYEPFETTSVQVVALARPPEFERVDGVRLDAPASDAFADAVGALQEATPEQRAAYHERVVGSRLHTRGLIAYLDGDVVGTGTVMLEDGWAGVFSMVTARRMRGRGLASTILGALLTWAWEHGAHHAYLQVDDDNQRALSVYRRFGFVTAYTYHYCARPGEGH
jgi:GNAT superfamily N-acetyltransferase